MHRRSWLRGIRRNSPGLFRIRKRQVGDWPVGSKAIRSCELSMLKLRRKPFATKGPLRTSDQEFPEPVLQGFPVISHEYLDFGRIEKTQPSKAIPAVKPFPVDGCPEYRLLKKWLKPVQEVFPLTSHGGIALPCDPRLWRLRDRWLQVLEFLDNAEDSGKRIRVHLISQRIHGLLGQIKASRQSLFVY